LKLGAELGAMLGFKDLMEIKHLARAVLLSKADLATQMVTEMTSLQGIIGGEYALRSSEDAQVAQAIAEQYQAVPKTKIGLALALSDRIDSLVGLFAAGLAPTGAKDPFGLRRAAIGVVQPLIEHDINFDLAEAVNRSAMTQPIPVSDEVKKQILEFLKARLYVILVEGKTTYSSKEYEILDIKNRPDVVEAVLAAQSNNPAGTVRAVKQLSAWVVREDWSTTLDGFARCVRILRSQTEDKGPKTKINEKALVEDEEKKLYKAIQTFVLRPPSTVDEFLEIVTKLIPSITAFFDKVLVMAEDKAVKENRLGLVGQVASLSNGIADLSKLEGF